MEFIEPEEFLKQDKEIQETFIDWWQPSEFDVYSIKEDLSIHRVCKSDIEDYKNDELYNVKSGYCIPSLAEGQIRQFIEDKVKSKLHIVPTNIGYRIIYMPETGTDLIDKCYEGDLLHVYWKVACEIAKEIANKN